MWGGKTCKIWFSSECALYKLHGELWSPSNPDIWFAFAGRAVTRKTHKTLTFGWWTPYTTKWDLVFKVDGLARLELVLKGLKGNKPSTNYPTTQPTSCVGVPPHNQQPWQPLLQPDCARHSTWVLHLINWLNRTGGPLPGQWGVYVAKGQRSWGRARAHSHHINRARNKPGLNWGFKASIN